jgi:hypothetical protein
MNSFEVYMSGFQSKRIMASGRKAGKSQLNLWMQHYQNMIKPTKISWRELPGNKLQAFVDPSLVVQPRGTIWGLRDSDMTAVQEWSDEFNCGKRMSFDVWKFKNRKSITMFLLRWSS